MAGKGGGAWKVAYADFVTAMMAFFLVMWITAQNKPLKQAVSKYFNDPFGTSKTAGSMSVMPFNSDTDAVAIPGRARGGRGRGSVESENKATSKVDRKRHVARRTTKMVLHDGKDSGIATTVLFEEGSAELTDQGKGRLRDLMPSLLGKPNKIELRGHSTRRPLPAGGPYQDEWQICYARCQSVMKFLDESGVETERIRLSQSAGFEPHTLRVDPESQLHNSRVEVYLLREFVDDLKGTREERAQLEWPAAAGS